MTQFKLAAFVVLGALASACGGPDRPANSPSSTDASDASGVDPAGTRDAGTSITNPPDTTGTNTWTPVPGPTAMRRTARLPSTVRATVLVLARDQLAVRRPARSGIERRNRPRWCIAPRPLEVGQC